MDTGVRILVTGGTGFLGRNLARSLLEKGHEVTILDNLSNSEMSVADELRRLGSDFMEGDIRDNGIAERIDHDCIVHLAAQISVSKSMEDPMTTIDINVNGTLNLLRAAAKNRVKRFIAASTAAVYGNVRSASLSEEECGEPASPYGASKLSMEKYIREFSDSYGMDSVSLRIFNLFGQMQPLNTGGVVTKFAEQIKRNEPLRIFGTGEQTRDFVHVDDVVGAIMLSLEGISGRRGTVYNIASGRSVSIADLASTMVRLSRKDIKITYGEPVPGDVMHSRASIEKAKADLKFVPRTDLSSELEKILN